MGLRFCLAKAAGAALTWVLRNVARRPAGNAPGKVALLLDPALIAHLRVRLSKGSILVVGTNGKTTVANLVADAIDASGQTVACNRGGANLDSGVATALLQTRSAEWGVFECDELWLPKVLPLLQADYVVLLNLFRDQLDRVGETDVVRERIVEALSASPSTVLVYTADDPQCAAVAEAVGNARIAVGVEGDLGLEAFGVVDEQTCWRCGAPLTYGARQYDQLGAYRCEGCGFARPKLDFVAHDVSYDAAGLRFSVTAAVAWAGFAAQGGASTEISCPQPAPYLLYNLLSAFAAACLAGVPVGDFHRAVASFDPRNGRLQRYVVDGRPVLLNLAKNPTGFNESLRLLLADEGMKAVALFVNDKEADGRDVSWIWDVDFERLGAGVPAGMIVLAGGTRRNDLQVRLKYAGLRAHLVEDVEEVFTALGDFALPPSASLYVIANYTALPKLRLALDALSRKGA